jgi:hypothetical protein
VIAVMMKTALTTLNDGRLKRESRKRHQRSTRRKSLNTKSVTRLPPIQTLFAASFLEKKSSDTLKCLTLIYRTNKSDKTYSSFTMRNMINICNDEMHPLISSTPVFLLYLHYTAVTHYKVSLSSRLMMFKIVQYNVEGTHRNDVLNIRSMLNKPPMTR